MTPRTVTTVAVSEWHHVGRAGVEPHDAIPTSLRLRASGGRGVDAIATRCATCDEVLTPETFVLAPAIDPDDDALVTSIARGACEFHNRGDSWDDFTGDFQDWYRHMIRAALKGVSP